MNGMEGKDDGYEHIRCDHWCSSKVKEIKDCKAALKNTNISSGDGLRTTVKARF